MLSVPARARVSLAFIFLVVSLPSLSACQPGPATPEPGALWVDPTQELGEISRFVLGGNHGPWTDFNPFAFEKTSELGVTFLRWPGGNWGDTNDITQRMIDNYIAQARQIGAEPSITVRVPGSTPEKAAEIVRYTNLEKGYGVRYWNLGNEPSLYDNDAVKNRAMPGGWNARVYAQTWREFALAMEAIDPTILFYGPDIHEWLGEPDNDLSKGDTLDYMIEFLKLNGDMVDVVTVHSYPYPTCNTCGNPGWEALRDNTAAWGDTIPSLRQMVKETTGKDLPVGVMEFNSNHTNVAGGKYTPDSFYNGLWLADVLGRLIEDRPEMLAYWLIKANNGGLGLMTSFAVHPTYYAFSLWTRFGSQLLRASSDAQYVSVYAAKTSEGAVTVMLVNLNSQAVSKPLKLHRSDALKLSKAYLFDATHNAEAIPLPAFSNGAEISLPAESATLLVLR